MALDKLALIMSLLNTGSGSGGYTKEQLDVLLDKKASLDNSGKVPLSELPNAVIERMITVTDDTARFNLTVNNVQLGDTVYVNSTKLMYIVIDQNELNSENGYQVYSAGTASKAIADQYGNTINDTYMRKDSIVKLDSIVDFEALTEKTAEWYFIKEG